MVEAITGRISLFRAPWEDKNWEDYLSRFPRMGQTLHWHVMVVIPPPPRRATTICFSHTDQVTQSNLLTESTSLRDDDDGDMFRLVSHSGNGIGPWRLVHRPIRISIRMYQSNGGLVVVVILLLLLLLLSFGIQCIRRQSLTREKFACRCCRKMGMAWWQGLRNSRRLKSLNTTYNNYPPRPPNESVNVNEDSRAMLVEQQQ